MKYYSEDTVKALLENVSLHTLKDCPCIKLPDKHGNLKDADFIISCLADIKDAYPKTYKVIKGILDRTPTVLEANNE